MSKNTTGSGAGTHASRDRRALQDYTVCLLLRDRVDARIAQLEPSANDPATAHVLAYLYRGTDGLFVNLDLARRGAAAVLSIRPNVAHAGEIAAAVDEARRAHRGRWGACPGT